MKDAFGGSFILQIMLIFFVIFICFMTVALNFAKVYRVKNNVINIIERFDSLDKAESEIESYLKEANYIYSSSGSNDKIKEHCMAQKVNEKNTPIFMDKGICIVPVEEGTYYRVIAYIVMDFPLFNVGTVIPISGETKILGDRLKLVA